MPKALLLVLPLLTIDLAFLAANVSKIPEGGWLTLLVAVALLVQMATWRRGRQLVAARIHRGERPIAAVLDAANDVKRVDGTAVFMFKDLGKAPPALVNNLRHNKVLHRTTLIVSVETGDAPRVPVEERAIITKVEPGVFQVLLQFGFMEEPDVPKALATIIIRGLEFDPDDMTYFIGRESILAGKAPGMHPLPSSCSCCSTAAPTTPAASSACPPTGSSKSAPSRDLTPSSPGSRLRLFARDEEAVNRVRTG